MASTRFVLLLASASIVIASAPAGCGGSDDSDPATSSSTSSTQASTTASTSAAPTPLPPRPATSLATGSTPKASYVRRVNELCAATTAAQKPIVDAATRRAERGGLP